LATPPVHAGATTTTPLASFSLKSLVSVGHCCPAFYTNTSLSVLQLTRKGESEEGSKKRFTSDKREREREKDATYFFTHKKI